MSATISLAVYDLDRTLWATTDHVPASFLPPPYVLAGPDTVRAGDGRLLELLPGVRAVLDRWTAGRVPLSLISANDRGPCEAILRTLSLLERFVRPQIEWEDRERGTCDKALLMERLLAQLEADGLGRIPRAEVVFVDDRAQSIAQVGAVGVRCVRFGVDIQRHDEVFAFLAARRPEAS